MIATRKLASAVGLVLLSTLLSLLGGELLLRLVLDPADFLEVILVEDPVLRHRIEPNTIGHDALGFRNKAVPEKVDVIAIGDSLTYGVSATREGSWPNQLGKLLGTPVYNMGLGGYGPMEYLYLLEHEALRMQPKQLVVGFYFGNDLLDACWAVEQKAHWAAWRSGGANMCEWSKSMPKQVGSLRFWMARHSVLYTLVKTTILARFVSWQKDQSAQQVQPDVQMLWTDRSNGGVKTIFTPQERLLALDLTRRGVQEGLRITKQSFDEMRDATARLGIQLLVVLIPTKERVYCDYLKQSKDATPATYLRLCAAEDEVKQDLVGYLSSSGIYFVDVTEPLRQQVSKHIPLYPTDGDAHPTASGYGVIARSIFDVLNAGRPVVSKEKP